MAIWVTLAAIALWIYCIFDVATCPEEHVRNLPKVYWLLIVILLFAMGSVLWLLIGRPWGTSRTGGGPRRPQSPQQPQPPASPKGPPKGPDDDPDFLRNLNRRLKDE